MKPHSLAAALALVLASPLALAAAEKPDLSIYEARTFSADGETLPYRWATPPAQKPGETYPLVVVLHGLGGKGTDNQKQLALGGPLATPHVRKNFPCFVILPQGKDDFPSFGIWGNYKDKKLAPQPTASTRLTLALVDDVLAKTPAIDRHRVYLVGESMGGAGVFEMLGRRPDLFAAGVPVYLGGPPDACETIAKNKIPIRLMNEDQSIPYSHGELKRLGADVDYLARYTGGEGHNGWSKHYDHDDYALLKWLFSVRKP